jgi:site-specific DNA-methyltransferase (cytosine-N4-specific)
MKLLTNGDEVVVDPFAGSNTTGAVAEGLRRRWLAVENVESYLASSQFRFSEGDFIREAPMAPIPNLIPS